MKSIQRNLLVFAEHYQAIQKTTLTERELSKAYLLMHYLRKKALHKKKDLFAFHPLSRNLLVKLMGNGYYPILKELKRVGLLEVGGWLSEDRFVESYEVGKRCKVYRFAPRHFSGDLIEVRYQDISSYGTSKHISINKKVCSKLIIEDDLASLVINTRKLLDRAKEHRDNIGYHSVQVGEEIEEANFKVNDVAAKKSYWISKEKCLEKCRREGSTLIKDGRRYYISDLDYHLYHKKQHTFLSYRQCIAWLKEKGFYVHRNDTNNRLDHNLTSLPKPLLQIIKKDNDLVEIDLSNSQYAILAHLMAKNKAVRKKADFILFQKEASTGILYEAIQLAFSLASRDEAKQMMMEICFSSHRYHSHYKTLLKLRYPTVVRYIEQFKKRKVRQYGKDGHKAFAIWLQKTEASIFIDALYFELKIKRGLFVVPKHDSFLVRATDELDVRKIMQDYFSMIGFESKLKDDKDSMHELDTRQ